MNSYKLQTILLFPKLPYYLFYKPLHSSPLHLFLTPRRMALNAVHHVADVPNLDHVQKNPSLFSSSTHFDKDVEVGNKRWYKNAKSSFMVIGHRGNGMNSLQSSDPRMKAIKENTILSFNTAASFNVDFIEFDVQVTKDGCPIIFHDNNILTEENGIIHERRVTELSLPDFLSYGPQNEPGKVGKPLIRKTKDGKVYKWDVEFDDILCTLQETFQKVDPKLGFNIELKFDDFIVYQQDNLVNTLQSILQVVFDNAKERPIIFSTFHPDAAIVVRKLQGTYPVFFLTNGGIETHNDIRRNSVEEAIKLCLEGGLQGIVSEVKGIFRNPGVVSKVKGAKLSLFTYGTLNNVPESVYMQHLMGIDAVIVDFVKDITTFVDSVIKQSKAKDENSLQEDMEMAHSIKAGVFSIGTPERSFLLKHIPELIQQ